MAGEAAALLDELMGKSRNVIPGKEVHEVEWWDSEVHIWACNCEDSTVCVSYCSLILGVQESPVRILSV